MGDKLVIQGLNGNRILSGEIPVKGAKNAALKAIAASILFRDGITLENVPDIEDINRMLEIMEELGASVTRNPNRISIHIPKRMSTNLPRVLSKRLRASMVLTGPLLARFGTVSFPHPGGCLIGARPIDLFIENYKKMGVFLQERNERYKVRVRDKKLKGVDIFLRKPSVTTTETLMMTALLAKGTTTIHNAAMEPEIPALADFLNTCGASIEGAGTKSISVRGGKLLQSNGKIFKIIPDRIETGSFLILGALSAKKLHVTGCIPEHMESLIEILRLTGISISREKNTLVIEGSPTSRPTALDVETKEYPGFPTDLQAPIAVFMTQAEGEATVFETIFEGRFRYIDMLNHMGADILMTDPHKIIVKGPSSLKGKELESPDLRAGLAYIIAAIVAGGESVIHNVYNIDRGYEQIEERLMNIGVDIQRITE